MALLLTAALLAMGVSARAQAQTNGYYDTLKNFSVEGCSIPFANKVWQALTYLSEALSTGIETSRCFQQARDNPRALVTRQEFNAVGPYVPCNPASGLGRDPELFFQHPEWAIGFAAARVNDFFRSDWPAQVSITCSNARSSTAWTPDNFGYGHQRSVRLFLGQVTWTARPGHELPGGKDIGTHYDFSAFEPSYPVEELAGIIAHELTHTHGFHHGEAPANECRYTTWDCDGSGPGRSCRANSVPEIVEACVSEIVERSVFSCPAVGPPFSTHPRRIAPVLYGYDSSCQSFNTADPRDGGAYLRTALESEIDRPGLDYAAVWMPSAGDCARRCVSENQCKAFSFVPATATCWLKSGVPAARPGGGVTSGYVRTTSPLGSGTIEYNVTRAGTVLSTTTLFGAQAGLNCFKSCDSNAACRSATFTLWGNDGHGQCQLKNAAGTASWSGGIASFSKL